MAILLMSILSTYLPFNDRFDVEFILRNKQSHLLQLCDVSMEWLNHQVLRETDGKILPWKLLIEQYPVDERTIDIIIVNIDVIIETLIVVNSRSTLGIYFPYRVAIWAIEYLIKLSRTFCWIHFYWSIWQSSS